MCNLGIIIFALKVQLFLFFFRATLESSTETKGMGKECTPGQMAQNFKATLKMIKKKVLERLPFPVVINLRFVHDIKFNIFFDVHHH